MYSVGLLNNFSQNHITMFLRIAFWCFIILLFLTLNSQVQQIANCNILTGTKKKTDYNPGTVCNQFSDNVPDMSTMGTTFFHRHSKTIDLRQLL